MRRKFGALVSVLLALFTGCGYASSGTWDDDPKNWKSQWGVLEYIARNVTEWVSQREDPVTRMVAR